MATFNGQRVTQRGGANAGRGDDPHGVTMPQWQRDQHAVAHADGFIGPRIGETYGNHQSSQQGTAPLSGGGSQPSPAFGLQGSPRANNVPGTAARLSELDSITGNQSTRLMQHKETGNIVEHVGGMGQANDWGHTATGQVMQPGQDANMAQPNTRVDTGSGDYTDITETVRGTQTYKDTHKPS